MPKGKPAAQLAPELIKEIGDCIRAGAFPEVAAQSLGIPLELYQKWLGTKGRKGNKLYDQLRLEVLKAAGHARFMAEMQMRSEDPKAWLMHGPGKDQPGLPGWSQPVKPVIHQDNRQVNVLLS